MSSPVSNRHWVVNASPLILLGDIGRVHLLDALCESLVVPDAVAAEVRAGPHEDAARRWLSAEGGSYVHEVGVVAAAIAGWDLGAGEGAVLTRGPQPSGI